ncbi:MAG: aminoacyl-tRNA hydrolase [Chloroflexi bacterium]|nr:aminoacyl-tRNA hydrolase [Chloroflexota bacterium]
MRLVVGLGNPGSRFAETRHNVGFMLVDRIAWGANARWQPAPGAAALVAVVPARGPGASMVLAKPLTFMNASGDAVEPLRLRLGLAPRHVLVAYDDMDLPLGALRLRERGSAGTHNGMKSLVARLQTDRFPRLRIGIGQSGARDARDYVLGGFTSAEAETLAQVLSDAEQAVHVWAAEGAAVAMNRFNKQSAPPVTAS